MGIVKQLIAGTSAGLGAFCLGTAIGWSGPASEGVMSGEAYSFIPSMDEWGWTSSLMTLGAACSCVPIGILIGVLGRKLTMLIIAPLFLVGWILLIFGDMVATLFAGRFIIGAFGGAFCITAPMYTTEIAEVRIRGALGSFFQLLLVHGILYSYIVGAFCDVLWLNILCAVMPIVFFVIFMWMPESPVFLAQKGKTEKAEKSLKWLRGKDANVSEDLNAMVASANKEKVNYKSAMCRKATIKGMFISIMLMLFQQFTGINAIIFYSTGIFKDAGTGISPAACTILIGVVMVVATIVAVVIIDKVGRRILLLVSALLMAITTVIMGVYFFTLMDSDIGWLPVTAICIFIIGFSIGFGPVPWLIMAELFAEDVKPVAGSVCGTTNWLFAFIVTKVFPICLEHLGPAITFWLFAVITVLAIVFIIFLVPETKGKTIDEIQAVLGK